MTNPIPTHSFTNLTNYSNICHHSIFTRQGGTSPAPFNSLNVRYEIGDNPNNIQENRQRICEYLKIPPTNLISANQTHSKNIYKVTATPDATSTIPQHHLTEHNEIQDTDALITNTPGLYLMIQVADCQPIILLDPVQKAIANIHSGWKSTVQNIVGATIEAMQKEFQTNPQDLIAAIGPSLAPASSEFTNRHNEFPPKYHQFFLPENKVDLWAITRHQLVEKGVKPENIEFSNIDTKENTEEFFSYRAEKTTGRFAVVVGLKH